MRTKLEAEYDWLLDEFQQSLDNDTLTGSRSSRTVALKLHIETILRKWMEPAVSLTPDGDIDTVATSGALESGDLRPMAMRH